MTTAPGREGKEAPEMPALSAFGCLMGFFMTGMCLIGPTLLWISTRFAPGDDDRMVVVAMGAVFTIGCTGTVIAHLWQNAKAREIHRGLDSAGVRATAEVVSSQRIWVGESPTAADELRFLVTGTGLTTFGAGLVTEDVGRYGLGARVPVDVDPRTNLFRLAD